MNRVKKIEQTNNNYNNEIYIYIYRYIYIKKTIIRKIRIRYREEERSVFILICVLFALREKCPNTELFLDRIQENTDQK